MADHPEGFNVELHDAWVADGNCPSVDFKTWCNGRQDHRGEHYAHLLLPSGETVMVYWDREDD